jgi:L-threonylcarbamoyladenylate synthase
MRYATVREAAEALREGRVVLVPTETVVGLVSAEAGLSRVWEVKGRDPGKPITRLCRDAQEAFSLAREVPALARRLAGDFWPGPLTLVLDAPDGGTVGVRVPAGETAQMLLNAYGGPLYATSANLSGKPAPATLDEVDRRIAEAVDLIVGGEAGGGEASAVVDLSGGRARLLREGAGLSEEALLRLAEKDV